MVLFNTVPHIQPPFVVRGKRCFVSTATNLPRVVESFAPILWLVFHLVLQFYDCWYGREFMPTHYVPTLCVDNVIQMVVVFCFQFFPPFGFAVAYFYFVRSHCYYNIAHNAPFVKGQSVVFLCTYLWQRW